MSHAPRNTVRAYASIAGVVALCLVLCGCRGAQLERDVYQRELRLQEDEIYRLEDYLGEYQQMVRQVRCENAELKKRLDELETASLSTPSAAGDEDPEESLIDRRRRRSTDSGSSKYDPKPAKEPEEASPAIPEIEFGAPSETLTPETDAPAVDAPDAAEIPLPDAAEEPPPFTPTDAPSTTGEPEAEAPPFQSEQSQSQTGPKLLRLSHAPAAQPITLAMTVEPAPLPLTSATPLAPIVPTLDRVTFTFEPAGVDATGAATLKLRVQPLDAQGKLLSLSGTAAVLVVDPNSPPESEKLARWDFAQHELAAAWQASGDERHLELWVGLPAGLPRDRPLELWIRVIDNAGRRAIEHQPLQQVEPQAEVATPLAESESTGWRASGPQAEGESQIRLVTHDEAVE